MFFHVGNLIFRYLLYLLCEVSSARQLVVEPLLLLFRLLLQLQYFLLCVSLRVDVLGEGVQCAFVRRNVLLEFFLCFLQCLLRLCAHTCLPVR